MIQRIGKSQFVFGMDWRDASSDFEDALESAREVEGGWYAVVRAGKRASDPACVGVFRPEGKPKGALLSFAAALAATGNDGLYILPMPDGRLWSANIRAGLVLQGADRIGDRDEVLRAVSDLLALSGRGGDPLKVFSPLEIRQPGWQVFDPAEIARTTRVKPLRPNAADAGPLVKAVAALAVVGVILGAGWWFFMRGPSAAEQAAMDAEAARQAYEAMMQQHLSGLPDNPEWIVRAFADVSAEAPGWIGGYVLQQARCTPTGCQAIYAADARQAHSPGLLRDRLGAQRVTFDATGRLATLSVPVVVGFQPVDSARIKDWPVLPDQVKERLAMMGTYLPGIVLQADPVPEDVSAQAGALPVGYRSITRTVLSLRPLESQALLWPELATMVDYWGLSGFVLTSVQWSHGFGDEPATWSAEFTRVSGVP